MTAAVPAAPTTPAASRSGVQSALEAWSEGADKLLEITWVLFIGGGLIFVVVIAVAALAVAGPPRLRASLASHRWVVGGGILFPTVVLTALLLYTFFATSSFSRGDTAAGNGMRVEVTGELWWWRVRYLDAQGGLLLETANEIHIPAGEQVELVLVSDNVIHSFWVPNLAGKLDMIPGHVNRMRIDARAPGVYRGQCAEYCGAQHARMAFHVVAHAPEDFRRWLQAQQAPARAPATPQLQQGLALFEQNRCGVCHSVRGTAAQGQLGPDLTWVGQRAWLAAGTLPNNEGTLAGWIADPQHLKDGALMPANRQFSGEELRALAGWLWSLR